ncbi:MAG: hypothetical protein M0R80_01900 [Proteobacteria bacterium]|jgi:hypothetical protein|nr:hypothetical protein [Pseudomonadota bacterium]
MNEEKPAKGVRGFLLYSPFVKKYFFRIYNEDKTFEDYDLCAADIEVEIIDNSIALYSGSRNKVDYTSKVLGIKDKNDKQI